MQCPGKCIQPGSWGGEYPRSLVISVSEISFYCVVDVSRSFGQRGKVVRIIGVKRNRCPGFWGSNAAGYRWKKEGNKIKLSEYIYNVISVYIFRYVSLPLLYPFLSVLICRKDLLFLCFRAFQHFQKKKWKKRLRLSGLHPKTFGLDVDNLNHSARWCWNKQNNIFTLFLITPFLFIKKKLFLVVYAFLHFDSVKLFPGIQWKYKFLIDKWTVQVSYVHWKSLLRVIL